jgi:hypothetical protein
MPTKTPQDLDQYLGVDLKQMKVIDVDYNVRVGYWASRNDMQEYKVYVAMIQMFDSDFVNNLRQAPGDNPWPTKPTNPKYRTYLLHQA